MLQWLLQDAAADVTDTDNYGRTVWYWLQRHLPSKPADQLAPALQALLARAAPPPAFAHALPAPLRPLLAQGAVVCARLPVGSAWRVQRAARLAASACGQAMPASVMGELHGYVEEDERELWALAAEEVGTVMQASK